MILPSAQPKNNSNADLKNAKTNNLANEFKQATIQTAKPSSPSTGVKIDTKKISMKEEFMCSKDELYRALTEQNVSVVERFIL